MMLRKMGTKVPKGKNPYCVKTQYQGVRQYLYGAAQEPILAQIIWARNPAQAYQMACDLDTLQGTAVGWEMLSVSPL